MLGLGFTTDLPPAPSVAGPTLQFGNQPDRVYPGLADVVHGQYLYRPEGQDIDLFRVDVPETGLFSAEVIAERQLDSSLLDSVIMLFRDTPDGTRELIGTDEPARRGKPSSRQVATISRAHSQFQERCLSQKTGTLRPLRRKTAIVSWKNS